MRHTANFDRHNFIYGVFIPRPEDIDAYDFCHAIGHWLNGAGIIYRGNIAEYAANTTYTKVLVATTAERDAIIAFFADASEESPADRPIDNFSRTGLIRRGWTARQIRDHLPAPIACRVNPRNYKTRPGWTPEDVRHVEHTVQAVTTRVMFRKLRDG